MEGSQGIRGKGKVGGDADAPDAILCRTLFFAGRYSSWNGAPYCFELEVSARVVWSQEEEVSDARSKTKTKSLRWRGRFAGTL
jgi:hypothetical protein